MPVQDLISIWRNNVMKQKIVLILYLFFFCICPSFGEENPEIRALREQVASLTKLVEKLNARIESLELASSLEKELGTTSPPAPSPSPRPSLGFSGGGNAIPDKSQNPDISVTGMAVGKASSDKRDPDRNTVGLDEAELVFSKNVSPYTRGNLTLGFHEDHAHVEEAYADFAHLLPSKLEVKIGKFLVPVGFLNTVHSHDWPMVARPIPLQNFLGEEGLSESGLSLSKPLDFRTKTYVKANLDFLKGENSILFNNNQTRVFGGRIFTNTPLNDRDDMNFGANIHQGAWNIAGDLDSTVYSVDLMLRRRYSQFNRLVLWGEWLWNRREQIARSSLLSKGYYLSGLYKFKKDRNWHVGIEYDCSEKPGDSRFNQIAKSFFVGYWFTENDRLQMQLRNVRDPFRSTTANEILLEAIWGMGPHKPHLANF